MKVTDVWQAAFVRLGAAPTDAQNMIAMISGTASSREAFDQWNSRLPDAAGRPLLRAIAAPDGDTFARTILTQFRDHMMQRFGISEDEVARHLRSIGLN